MGEGLLVPMGEGLLVPMGEGLLVPMGEGLLVPMGDSGIYFTKIPMPAQVMTAERAAQLTDTCAESFVSLVTACITNGRASQAADIS